MNHQIWTAVGVRVAVLSFALAGLTACGERLSDTHARAKAPSGAASPSAVVVGQAPAQPTGDPAGTSPVAPNTSEVTKREETTQKPDEGDNHSHSTLAPDSPQKAEGKNPQETPQRSSNQ